MTIGRNNVLSQRMDRYRIVEFRIRPSIVPFQHTDWYGIAPLIYCSAGIMKIRLVTKWKCLVSITTLTGPKRHNIRPRDRTSSYYICRTVTIGTELLHSYTVPLVL
jgi:hypothetical protein